ncbi:MAG: acetate kinase [Bacteroidales bacterium]|nr:acetate kinase [Bacteroidales bacterium]
METEEVLCKGLVERIGQGTGVVTHKPVGKEGFKKEMPIPDHTVGIQAVLAALTDPVCGVLSSLEDIEAVGHRVLHGGEEMYCSQLVTEAVKAKIDECAVMAPLHNHANLLGILAVEKVLPSVPQVVVFDTAFHHTMPAHNFIYALPYEYYEKYHIRRYGFHGTSHRYVSARGAAFAGVDINNSKIITCHLGNGSSISAVENGKCVITSMGLTPLEGLTMGTRCGDIDPDAVTFIQTRENMSPADTSTFLNKKSGLLGISGISSDCRDVTAAAIEGNPRAKLALKKLIHDIIRYIGAYAAEMNGVDLIIFTGGIGENHKQIRHQVMENLSFLGVDFDPDANEQHADEFFITKPSSRVKAAVIATNEELVIAQDTMHLVQGNQE